MPICAKSVKKRNPDTLAIPPSVALLAIEKALSAPRQPTDRMVAAGKEQMFVYLDEDDMVAEDGVRLIFNAMTAAA